MTFPKPLPFLLLAALLALGCGVPFGGAPDAGGAEKPHATDEEQALGREVLRLCNEERARVGISALTWNEQVAQVAYEHSADMEARGFFDHTNPDGQGPSDRLDRAGIAYSRSGENIAQGYPTPEEVVAAWMNSDGHRENILRAAYSEVGVGARKGDNGPWWTQVFRTP